jgi:putative resolvase
MEKMLSVKKTCQLLGIHPSTLRRWMEEGLIKYEKTPKGQRRYPESEIRRLLGKDREEIGNRAAIYSRVSSHEQKNKGDLERQTQRLKKYVESQNWELVKQASDVASGLSSKRQALDRLMTSAQDRDFDILVVENKDRLTRFGWEYLEKYFQVCGVKIVVVEGQRNLGNNVYQELTEDLISIVASFSGKLYGLRGSKRAKQLVEVVKTELDKKESIDANYI